MKITSAEGKAYRFETAYHNAEDEAPVEFYDQNEALLFLTALADNQFNRLALRQFALDDLSLPNLHKVDDKALWNFLAADIVTLRVRVFEGGRTVEKASFGGSKPASGNQSSAQGEDDPVADVVTPPPSTEKTWIKFEIVDDDTGEPVKGVTLKVKLSDGQTRNGRSNAAGIIEFKDIPEGTCAIEKMIDADTLEVVSVE